MKKVKAAKKVKKPVIAKVAGVDLTMKAGQDDDKKQELCALAKNIIIQAKKMGATAVEVDLVHGSGLSVMVRKGDVESVEHSSGKTLGVTVYFGQRTGTALTSDLSNEAVHLMLKKACYFARFTSEDPCVGLADPDLMAYNHPDLDLYHPWEINIEQAIALAKECEAHGFSQDSRIVNSEGVSIDSSQVFSLYANSHGFLGGLRSTRHGIGCALIAKDNVSMQRDGYSTVARDSQDLETPRRVAKKAAELALNRLHPRHLTTRKCPVLFRADVAKEIFDYLISAISGGSLFRKASFLLNRLNTQVLPKHLSLEEKPHLHKAIGSAPFDGEGVKNGKSKIVENGILTRYVLDSYSARKLKMKTTGNAGGVHNLFVNTSDLDFKGMLKLMGKGLLVVDLMGDGVNIVTGDYSRGVFGFWVERGEIQYPVEGVTIAGNLKEMLLNIVAVGKDVDRKGGVYSGSILLDKMMVAGR